MFRLSRGSNAILSRIFPEGGKKERERGRKYKSFQSMTDSNQSGFPRAGGAACGSAIYKRGKREEERRRNAPDEPLAQPLAQRG